MPRVPRLRRCTSYAPGHTVHRVQALHTVNKPEVARRTRKGTPTADDGDVLTIRVAADTEPERVRNHEPQRLLAIARRPPAGVSLNDDYNILRSRYVLLRATGRQRVLRSVPGRRPTGPQSGGVGRADRTHGGFSVPLSPAAPRLSDPPDTVRPEAAE